MSGDESTWLEDEFPERLADCDDALANGSVELPVDLAEPSSGLCEQLTREVEWCRFVRRHWVCTPAHALGTTMPLPWRRLGRYEIRRELGRGAFGVVFLGFDPDLRREVALKVPRPEALFSPEFRARFRREARAAASLDHPHIVPVHDTGEERGVCFIASAFCPGITLADWLRLQKEPMASRKAAGLIALLAEAVQHAHRRGVLHRDLKPANILLVREPGKLPLDPTTVEIDHFVPRITDFGLTKTWGAASETDEPSATTLSGTILGTPAYMAPEQAEGGGQLVGQRADVYALGAILYELLAGQPPYQADSPLQTLVLVRTATLKPPSKLRPGTPSLVETICVKCLEKEPEQRYPSAGELAEDLRRFLAGLPLARPRPRTRKWLRRCWRRGTRRPVLVALAIGALASSAVWITLFAALGRGARPNPARTGSPLCAWSFNDGFLPPGASTGGTELIDSRQGGYNHGIVLHFMEHEDAWLRVPFTGESAPRASGKNAGRWVLYLDHHADGPPDEELPLPGVALFLNEHEVWNARTLEPAPPTGVPWWQTIRLDVTARLQNGANLLRWTQPVRAPTRYALRSFRLTWEPVDLPAPSQLPSFFWDFGKGDAQGTSRSLGELVDITKIRAPDRKEGCFMRLFRNGESWLEAPFVIPAVLPERMSGSWFLTIHHKRTVVDSQTDGYTPILVTLNGQELLRGLPDEDESRGPNGVWAVDRMDISRQLRRGDNVLRWELLADGKTVYWLKSFRIGWEPSPQKSTE